MVEDLLTPDYIFEASWEVYDKVEGICIVLSTGANTLQTNFRDKSSLIGLDVWQGKENPLFIEPDNLYAARKEHVPNKDNLSTRVGRWDILGEPIIILVDFQPFLEKKNKIYIEMWNHFQADSLHTYGDHDGASMFSYAAGKVVESFYRYNLTENDKVVYQAHEWVIGLGALYVQLTVPKTGTIFTIHATSIDRSIAGNDKPLYNYLFTYNGNQMAQELNMQSRHSIEKQTTHHVDCFTTVSEITNNGCKKLLDKAADVALMNGLGDDFVPQGTAFTGKRKCVRSLMSNVVNKLLGTNMGSDTSIIGTSGRYEFKNKRIGVFLESLNRLNRDKDLQKNVLAFVNVPGWIGKPHEDLQTRLKSKEEFDTPLEVSFITHWLRNMTHDQVLDMLKYLDMGNRPEDKVKVTFVPCYLDGKDGILNKECYDLILGEDLNVYPSYYEPWGYTSPESVAFRVPIITADLAGFGLWVNSLRNQHGLDSGAEVPHRSDYNYSKVAGGIKNTIALFSGRTEIEVKEIRKHAAAVVEQVLRRHFTKYYYEAYDIALRGAMKRQLN